MKHKGISLHRILFILGIACYCAWLWAVSDNSGVATQKRLEPPYALKLKPAEASSGASVEVAAQPRNIGEEIYEDKCAVCHDKDAPIKVGSPVFRSKEDWEPRLKQGMDSLVESAIKGKGAMPPKGTCVDCTKQDIRETIEYMLPAENN